MDNVRPVTIIPLPDNTDINTLCKSYHENVYSFEQNQSQESLNYPASNIAGFLTVNTDFNDEFCVQKITTMDRKFFFRTGKKTGGVFIWGDWDRYASITDIPAKSIVDLQNTYVTKEEMYTKVNNEKKNNFEIHIKDFHDFPMVNIYGWDPDYEIDGYEQRTFKYYGTFKDEDLMKYAKLIHEKDTLGKGKGKGFILGYLIREEELPATVDLDAINQPSRNPGLLQIYSSIISYDRLYRRTGGVNRLEDSNIEMTELMMTATLVFHDFITGDIYTTRIVEHTHPLIFPDPYYETTAMSKKDIDNIFEENQWNSRKRTMNWYQGHGPIHKTKWTRYSYSSTRSYELNNKALNFLRAATPYYRTPYKPYTDLVDDTGNDTKIKKGNDNDNVAAYTTVVAWNNNTAANIVLNNNGIPYNNTLTEKDTSLINSLYFNGHVPRLTNPTNPENADAYKRGLTNFNFGYDPPASMGYSLWNTFCFTYTTNRIKYSRYNYLEESDT